MAVEVPPADVAEPKLASVVAGQLEDEIVRAEWPVGEVIGSEPELLARFGVSRAVLREAIRIGEHHGAGVMRRGPGGGLVVAAPDPGSVETAASIWFAAAGVTVGELLDALAPLHTAACRLAAERIDEAGITVLRDLVREVEGRGRYGAEEFAEIDLTFASLAHSPALELFIRATRTVLIKRIRGMRAEVAPPVDRAGRQVQMGAYRRLADAIVQGDGGAAAGRAATMQRALRHRLHDRPAAKGRPRNLTTGPGKLAERLAERICDDIEQAGWPVGMVLGSEADLIARYGVSRAVLREAERILEHHRAVRTRRGPGGGLIVDEPDGRSVARAAELLLEFERVSPEHLLEARAPLEIAAVKLAAERCTPATAGELRVAVAKETEAAKGDIEGFHVVHRNLAQASGSRPIRLFVDVLTDLTSYFAVRSPVSKGNRAAIQEDVAKAHSAIIEAVIAGDVPLAQHRMMRHLEATIGSIRRTQEAS